MHGYDFVCLGTLVCFQAKFFVSSRHTITYINHILVAIRSMVLILHALPILDDSIAHTRIANKLLTQMSSFTVASFDYLEWRSQRV